MEDPGHDRRSHAGDLVPLPLVHRVQLPESRREVHLLEGDPLGEAEDASRSGSLDERASSKELVSERDDDEDRDADVGGYEADAGEGVTDEEGETLQDRKRRLGKRSVERGGEREERRAKEERLTFIRTTKPKKMNPNQDRYGWKGAVDEMIGKLGQPLRLSRSRVDT